MNPLRCPLGPILGLVLALTAPATAQAVDFSETVTFGDSLTDNGLLGFPFNQSLYGRDPMQAVFDKGRGPQDNLRNYAVAGSTSSAMLLQIARYAPSYFGPRRATTISFEIGGNDLLNRYTLLASSPPGQSAAADAVINTLITNFANDFILLWTAHPGATFVVWTVADITHTPRYWSQRNTQGAANVRAHTARINDLLRPLDAVPGITILDTETLARQLGVAPPLIAGRQLLGPPAFGRHDAVFADPIHPTAVTNALLANEIIRALNAERGTSIPSYGVPELAALARIE